MRAVLDGHGNVWKCGEVPLYEQFLAACNPAVMWRRKDGVLICVGSLLATLVIGRNKCRKSKHDDMDNTANKIYLARTRQSIIIDNRWR